MARIALFAGSFDPFTKGHEDIVLRGIKIFDEVVVAIGINSEKSKRYFPVEVMIGKINHTFAAHASQVKVITYSNKLTATLANEQGAQFLLRGVRNSKDLDYESGIAQINKHLNKDLESVFLITNPNLAGVSSTIIREVLKYGGDVSAFLPYSI